MNLATHPWTHTDSPPRSHPWEGDKGGAGGKQKIREGKKEKEREREREREEKKNFFFLMREERENNKQWIFFMPSCYSKQLLLVVYCSMKTKKFTFGSTNVGGH